LTVITNRIFSSVCFIGFNVMMKYIFLIMITQIAYSQKIENPTQPNQVSLTIIPHICIAPRGTKSCISSIDIIWVSTHKGNYCLNSNLEKKLLACWNNTNKGTYQHQLVFNQNIIYKMLDSLSQESLAKAVMKFKTLKPQRQYKNRHKRFPWSISTQ